MRTGIVLAIAVSVLLAFGVACGGDEEEARVTPIPATDSEGEAEEGEGWEDGGEWEGAAADDDGGNGGGYSEEDVEYQLAVIDEAGFVPTDDPSIDAYAAVLDRLETKCEEDRTLIGSQAVIATRLLANEGISVTALEALRGIDGSIPAESPVLSCAEIAAAWVDLQTGP